MILEVYKFFWISLTLYQNFSKIISCVDCSFFYNLSKIVLKFAYIFPEFFIIISKFPYSLSCFQILSEFSQNFFTFSLKFLSQYSKTFSK